MSIENAYNEKELLLQVAKGDEQAFALLIERYSRKTFTHILTFVKSYEVAEELAQDVFIKIWDNRAATSATAKSFSPEPGGRAYILADSGAINQNPGWPVKYFSSLINFLFVWK